MTGVNWPEGFRLERLRRDHPRGRFHCGEPLVDQWLASKSWQHQEKHLSVTKVLIDDLGAIAGYYTLATGQVSFADLPVELTRGLPRRALPVAVLAWLGASSQHQGQGIGGRLLAQALHDCYEAGETLAFVAVILDCLNDDAKKFYQRWDFVEFPGHLNRLVLTASQLKALMNRAESE